MTEQDAELQSDTRRPRQRHPPSASLSGRVEGGEGEGGGEEEEERGGGGVGEGRRGEGSGGGKGGRPAQETEVRDHHRL